MRRDLLFLGGGAVLTAGLVTGALLLPLGLLASMALSIVVAVVITRRLHALIYDR
jgi:hypothetical protein